MALRTFVPGLFRGVAGEMSLNVRTNGRSDDVVDIVTHVRVVMFVVWGLTTENVTARRRRGHYSN